MRAINYNPEPREPWQLDKKISLTVIISLIVFAVTGIWAVADSRAQLNELKGYPERLTRLEAKVDNATSDIREIRNYILNKK